MIGLLFLFYRNAKKELNDIRFEFAVGKDSAEGIASELIGAGLVDTKDMGVITSNLQQLVDSRDTLKVVTFPLVSIHKLLQFFKYLEIFALLYTYKFIFINSRILVKLVRFQMIRHSLVMPKFP